MPRISDSATPGRRRALALRGRLWSAARRRAGLTQEAAAAALSVPVWTYRSWERGTREAPADARARAVESWGADPRLAREVCPHCGRADGRGRGGPTAP